MEVERIPLGRDFVTVVDAGIMDRESRYFFRDGQVAEIVPRAIRWTAQKNRHKFYAFGKYGIRLIHLARLLIETPAHLFVDHRDGDSLNNRTSNIRSATNSQNMANETVVRGGASKYRGVRSSGLKLKPWGAQIHYKAGGKERCKHLGAYATEEEAAIAYNHAAVEFFGEFARLNIIKPKSIILAGGQFAFNFAESPCS
jgi:hypothetical protein